MTKDKSIFGLRFGSNEELAPTREELEVFLKSPKEEGRRELHGNDLATYRELLEAVEAFEQHQQQQYAAPLSFRDKMFYGVLGHSHFFSPVLASEVEQFKYHLHTLLTLDLKKPTAFIKSAEAEMSRLNPKKRDDAVKLARLHTMVDERKKTLETTRETPSGASERAWRHRAVPQGQSGHDRKTLRSSRSLSSWTCKSRERRKTR